MRRVVAPSTNTTILKWGAKWKHISIRCGTKEEITKVTNVVAIVVIRVVDGRATITTGGFIHY